MIMRVDTEEPSGSLIIPVISVFAVLGDILIWE